MKSKHIRTGTVVRDTRHDIGSDYIREGTKVELLSGVERDGYLLCKLTRSRAVAIPSTDITLDNA